MLVGFLQSLNFCQLVEPSVLEITNLQTTPSHSTADLLFFPDLVQSERTRQPHSAWSTRVWLGVWGVWILSSTLVLASFMSSSSLSPIDSHSLSDARLLHLFVVSSEGAMSGRTASLGQTLIHRNTH